MAPIDRLTGTDVVIHFLPTGGTPGVDELVLSGDYTAFQWNRQVDTVDVTAGNEKARYEKGTIEALDWSATVFDAEQSFQADILPMATGLLSVYKKGTGTSKPYFSFNTLITGFSEDMGFDQALEIDLSGVRQGAMIAELGSTTAP